VPESFPKKIAGSWKGHFEVADMKGAYEGERHQGEYHRKIQLTGADTACNFNGPYDGVRGRVPIRPNPFY